METQTIHIPDCGNPDHYDENNICHNCGQPLCGLLDMCDNRQEHTVDTCDCCEQDVCNKDSDHVVTWCDHCEKHVCNVSELGCEHLD